MICQLSYARKVRTRDYENISIGYQIEFDNKVRNADEVYTELVGFVEDKISQRLHEMGLK